MFTNEILETVLTVAAAGALLAPVVTLLERTHRRTSADHGGRSLGPTDRRDADARRVGDELRARAGEDPANVATGTEVRTVRTHHAR